MPTYQYKCKECSHDFEQFQSMTADPIQVCPACEGAVERLISGGAGFLFKGDGFYTTDYRSESYKKGEKADKDSSSSSSETAKSDSKKSESSKTESSKSDSSSSTTKTSD
jgi:putative FmdB family regulatory protein